VHIKFRFLIVAATILAAAISTFSQAPSTAEAERGSQTAKNGFANETEIAGKFNNWQTDGEAKTWLGFMGYKLAEVESVTATKPHGEKADVEVKVKTRTGEKTEGISIKLVSTSTGFNQIDKRWLAHYAKMWNMPADVVDGLKFFVGESKPDKPSRNFERMYLNELDEALQKKIVEFFAANRTQIVGDLFQGDGSHAAGWIMVALKVSEKPRWVLRRVDYAIKYYGNGPVAITRQGNLKIGRITMQRKGGDNGRDSARMLQFKINPVELFEAK
jgi:hypothetical protein